MFYLLDANFVWNEKNTETILRIKGGAVPGVEQSADNMVNTQQKSSWAPTDSAASTVAAAGLHLSLLF